MQSMKKTSKNIRAVLSIMVVKHCLLTQLPKMQNRFYQEAGPHPKLYTVFSCKENPHLLQVPVGFVAYLEGGCFKTCTL